MATELVLTTIKQIEDTLSVEGLSNQIDHSGNALVQANIDALGEVEFFLTSRYLLTSADVLASRWLQTVILYFTLYHLLSQRNNQPPANITNIHDRYLEQLEQIRTGKAELPNVPQGSTGLPAAFNFNVDHTAYPALRVDGARSAIPSVQQPVIYGREFPRPQRI